MIRIQKIGLLFVLLLVTTFVHAQTKIGNVYYKIIENTQTAKVCAGQEAYTGAIEIPGTIKFTENGSDYQVVAIEESAFKDATGLTSISIPANVKTIGTDAFKGCTNLTKAIFASVNDLCAITFANASANPMSNTWAQLYNSKGPITTINEPISQINAYAFYGCSAISIVWIPENITSIGTDAFSGCKNIQEVHYANMTHLTTMSYETTYSNPIVYAKEVWLYNDSKKLTEVTIRNNVNNSAFRGAKWLTKVTFDGGDNVTTIGTDAFLDCTGLSEIALPSSLTTIGQGAFRGSNLNSIIIPENTIFIAKEAFYDCKSLESVQIDATLNEFILPEQMFYGCTKLKSVKLNENIVKIGKKAFMNCSSLTSLPDGNLIEFGQSAFEGCKGFTELTLPKNIEKIGDYAFKNCNNLTDLFIPAEVTNLTIGSEKDSVFCVDENLNRSLIIYSNTRTAPKSSVNPFAGYKSIKVYIPSGDTSGYDKSPWTDLCSDYEAHTVVYYVDDAEIYHANVVVGQPIQTEENEEFINALQSIKESRPNWDFAGWDKEIPSLMPATDVILKGHFTREYTSHGDDDYGVKYFLRSDNKTAKVTGYENPENPGSVKINPTIDLDEVSYTIDSIGANAFNGKNLKEIDLSDATTNIGISLFEGCTALENVILPAALTEIKEKMFYGCTALSTLVLPDNVEEIGTSAFEGCTNYNIDHLPSGLKSLGKAAFKNSGIIEITLPSSIEPMGMGENVFQSCVNLKNVVFEEDEENEEIITVLPAYTFSGCSNLESFTLPASIETIGEYAFNNCSGLKLVVLDNIVEIRSNAFSYCNNLKAITLPTITTLGSRAFSYCKNVEMITIESTNPPSVGENTFSDDIYSKATLCAKNIELYNADQYENTWKRFTKKEAIGASWPKLIYKLDGEVYRVVEQKTGMPVEPLAAPNADDNPKGRAFSGWKDEPKIMPNKDSVIVGSLKYQRTYKAEGTTDVLYSDSLFYGYEVSHPDNDLKKDRLSYVIIKPFETMPAKDSILYVSYSLTTAPTGKDNTFNNVDQDLINYLNLKEGSGTLKYSLDKKIYSTEVKGKDAKTYKVYYKVFGVTEHYNTEPDSIEVTIAPRTVNKLTIKLKENENGYTYDGKEKKPEVESVSTKINSTETLIPKNEYKVSYGNNINATTKESKAQVIIKDNLGGNYIIEDASTTFEIKPAKGKLADLLTKTGKPTAIAPLSYTGKAQNLIKAGTIKEGISGSLKYSLDNKSFDTVIPQGTDAKDYTIYYKVEDDPNYTPSDTASLKVTIKAKEITLSAENITLEKDTYTYDGTAKKPGVTTVKIGGITIPAEEYTVSYQDNINVGTATVIITDKDGGNYIVSGSKTFKITPVASSLTNAPTGKNLTYNGSAQELLNKDGKTSTGTMVYSLSQDEATFKSTIPTGTDAKTYTVFYRVKGDDNHSDSEIGSVKVTIAPRKVNALSLIQSSYTYTGVEIKADVTVTWNQITVPGSEYMVSCSNNINVGTATVTVKDKEGGNFTVSGSKTFTISKAPLTISADSYDIFEGEKIPEFTAKYDGFVNNETEAVLTAKPIFSCNATATSKPGNYTISVGGSKAANYVITHKSGKLTIIAMKFVSGGESSKDEDDPATYQITSTGEDVGTTPTVAIVDDKDVGGSFAIPEAITYHNTNYKITEINESAFENNKYLTEVSIPSSITSIGDKAFKGCSNLKSITVYITTPISLAVAGTRGEGTRSDDGTFVFEGVDKLTCVLYVPDGSVDLYKAAPVWCEFKHIVPISTLTGISSVNITEGEPFDVYNLQGRKVKSMATDLRGLPRGIYIINDKKVAVK